MKYRIYFNLLAYVLVLNLNSCSTSLKVKNLPSKIENQSFQSNTKFFATITTIRPTIKYDKKTLVRIPNAIPNTSLIYFHDDEKFRADYTIEIRFYQEEKLVFNQIFNGSVEEDTYKDTEHNLLYLSTLTVLISPGKYDIDIIYQCDVRIATKKVKNVIVPNYNIFSLASPHLINYNGKKIIDNKLIDSYTTNYTNFLVDEEDCIFLTELYNVNPGPIKFRFDIFKGDELIQTNVDSVTIDSTSYIYLLPPMKIKMKRALNEGVYVLKIEISDNYNNFAKTEVVLFKEHDIMKYSSERDWKDTTKLLSFIGSYNEIKALKKLKTLSDRKAGVHRFWKKRDNGENIYIDKAQFYKRVQFVNEKFGRNKFSGWKEDRGRIYIKLGRPDNIDINSMNSNYHHFRGKPYEVWTYEILDKIFIFVDHSRTGVDYRLMTIYNRRGDNLGLDDD